MTLVLTQTITLLSWTIIAILKYFISLFSIMNTTNLVPNDFQIQQGTTWIGGPTHELQRQHIPGYSGHIHGLHA